MTNEIETLYRHLDSLRAEMSKAKRSLSSIHLERRLKTFSKYVRQTYREIERLQKKMEIEHGH